MAWDGDGDADTALVHHMPREVFPALRSGGSAAGYTRVLIIIVSSQPVRVHGIRLVGIQLRVER